MRVRDTRFRTRQRSKTLPQTIGTTAAIARTAGTLLRDLRPEAGDAIRLVGVRLSGLEERGAVLQGTLLDEEPESDKDRRLERVRREVEARVGEASVYPAHLSR